MLLAMVHIRVIKAPKNMVQVMGKVLSKYTPVMGKTVIVINYGTFFNIFLNRQGIANLKK